MSFELTRRLVLEEPSRTPDGAGGFTELWSNLGYIWAQIEPIGAGTEGVPEGLGARLRTRITMRAAPVGSSRRPVTGQRLREGARAFEVEVVTEAEHPLYIWVWAREVTLA
ncbi:MAG: head-tail adaptor protein [Pseudomonadota bacterium]